MSKGSWPQWGPPTPGRRGQRGSYDPFYQFEKAAREHGTPHQAPPPKAEMRLVALLASKAAMAVMGCLLAVVVLTLLVLLVLKA